MVFILLREHLTLPIQTMTHDFNDKKMMYDHMVLSPMDWSSLTLLGTISSLILFGLLYYFLFTNYNNCMLRWNILLNKVTGINLLTSNKSYLIVTCTSIIVFLNNLYSIYSFNWSPSTQSWIMLLLTTMFLLTMWTNMVFTAGMKLFGQKVPISWYLINLSLWAFHNLSFFIRFISLPFRMMMNLMVGCFLVEFGKSSFPANSLISVYEMFVITVQTLVFILLMNMYYSEMTMTPEWKHISPKPQFFQMKPTIQLFKTKLIMLTSSLFSFK
uniref:ATP synthase F0 subunit 6 n=1 Tax=Trichuris trichiura TaxID=36087 RepID=A0A891GS85_TRITR|nr:ATP synthase F0 subunit 6 [Trichuris trichiura]